MIFVTVGTHEQQFNRLIKSVDDLKKNNVIKEDVIMQIGYSTYEPQYCKWSKLIPYKEMIKNIKNARIVITHGGPASFILPLQLGKIPIVVPRQLEFEEHVNNHQLDFVKIVEERMGNIIPVYDVNQLKKLIENYDQIISEKRRDNYSNNINFCNDFENIMKNLLKE